MDMSEISPTLYPNGHGGYPTEIVAKIYPLVN